MKITSYEQIDKLVAQSLGWKTSIKTFEGSDDTMEFFHPPNTNVEDWYYSYYCQSSCPDFSTNWEVIEEFLLSKCDQQDCIIEIIRTKEGISCQIKPQKIELWESKHFNPITVFNGLPRSTSLAICLAWLAFKGFELELELNEL